ncbi:MAG: PAS domain S-box protein [Chloroflexi bacterium]|nr:PAS domain S-box protein [Chloroflexota bacterium]
MKTVGYLAATRWSQRTRLIISIVAWAIYALTFFPIAAFAGESTGTLVTVPIIVTAWVFGLRGGLLAALLNIPITAVLFSLGGRSGWNILYQRWAGIAAGLMIGLVTGGLSELLRQLQQTSAALRQTRDELEKRVEERMAQLAEANTSLEEALQTTLAREQTILAAQESQAHLAAIVESSEDAIISQNTESQVLSWNSGAERLYGYTAEEMIGQRLTDKLPPEQQTEGWQIYNRIMNGEVIKNYETVRRRRDGRDINVSMSVSPIRDADGKPNGISVIARDITEQQQLENRLRESEARLRAIAEATPIPIMINTVDEGITRYGNPALADMMGLPLEKLIGDRATSFYVYPSERAEIINDLKTHRSLRNYEVPLKRADGTPLWVSLSSELITFNDEPCVLTGFYDITIRRRVEERERAITQGLRAVVEAADELLGYDDLDTLYRRAVELAREKLRVERCAIFLLDPSKEHLWGTYGTDIQGNTTDERWLQISAAPHTHKFNTSSLKWHTRLENERTTIENGRLKVIGVGWAVTTVIRTTAGPLGVFINDAAISNTDLDEATQESIAIYCSLLGQIIESKLAEKAIQESLKEKEVLIKEVHHRVKNNMQVIVSMINLQSDYITDAKALAIFGDTQHRVRAMALVHEKLYQSNNLAQIDFRDYIEHLASSLFHSYSPYASRITLHVDVGDVALSVDSAIPCGLIVNELISNALKYAFPDNRPGELIVRLREADAGWIEMNVEDDGVGLPNELDLRNTESLGMQLVYSLAKQVGGTLDLNREHGTKFRLRFPIRSGR